MPPKVSRLALIGEKGTSGEIVGANPEENKIAKQGQFETISKPPFGRRPGNVGAIVKSARILVAPSTKFSSVSVGNTRSQTSAMVQGTGTPTPNNLIQGPSALILE